MNVLFTRVSDDSVRLGRAFRHLEVLSGNDSIRSESRPTPFLTVLSHSQLIAFEISQTGHYSTMTQGCHCWFAGEFVLNVIA